MKLKIEDKADRTAKGYEFICPIFRLDKTSLHQGLERLIAFNFKCYYFNTADADLRQDPAFRRCCLSRLSLQELFAEK